MNIDVSCAKKRAGHACVHTLPHDRYSPASSFALYLYVTISMY